MGLGITIAVDGQPDAQLAQANLVEVQQRMGKTTTYRLHYAVDISEGDLPWLVDDRLDAGSELSLLVPVGSGNECLVKGPVQGQRIHLQHGGAGSTLEVRGGDSSLLMEHTARTNTWSDVTDSDVVKSILESYGYTADVEPTAAGHFEEKHTLIQRESDLSFVRRLARRYGFLFWLTSDAAGIETAHFRRPPVDGDNAAELTINLESPTIDQLDIQWDVDRPTRVEAAQLDLNTKATLDGSVGQSRTELLGSRGAADVAGDRSMYLVAPSDDAGDLQARAEGVLADAQWFIRARCRTSIEQLGVVVQSHQVVTVRGAGSRHSGRYFVAAVRHTIDAAAHRMELELLRNAWE